MSKKSIRRTSEAEENKAAGWIQMSFFIPLSFKWFKWLVTILATIALHNHL